MTEVIAHIKVLGNHCQTYLREIKATVMTMGFLLIVTKVLIVILEVIQQKVELETIVEIKAMEVHLGICILIIAILVEVKITVQAIKIHTEIISLLEMNIAI